MILILLGIKLVLWPLFDRVVFFCTSCMLLVAKLEDICKSWHDLQAHIFQELDCYVLRRCALYTKSDREKSDWWNLKRVVLLEKTMLQDVSPASSHSSNNTSVQIQRLQATTIVLYKYWDLSRADTYELHTLKMLSLLQVVKQYFCSVMWSSIQIQKQIHDWFLLSSNQASPNCETRSPAGLNHN